MNAALRLQPRCSEKTEKESSDSVITTRLLVGRSQIGCLMGKGGAIISEMRNQTRANIRIISEDSLPKVAGEDDEMVQVNVYNVKKCGSVLTLLYVMHVLLLFLGHIWSSLRNPMEIMFFNAD